MTYPHGTCFVSLIPSNRFVAFFRSLSVTHSVSMMIFDSAPKPPEVPDLGRVTTAGDSRVVSKTAPSTGTTIAVVAVTSLAMTATSRLFEESPSPTMYRNSRTDVPLPPS